MKNEILNLIREKGLLLEKDIFEVLENFDNLDLAGGFLEGLEKATGNKMITISNLSKNFGYVKQVVESLPGEQKNSVERYFVKMGFSFEVVKENSVEDKPKKKENKLNYKIFYAGDNKGRKISVKDFVGHFRSRYHELQGILMQRPDLQNLVSINKLGSQRQSLTIIGIVSEKRITKNKNLIITFEDLTGEINALVKQDSEIFTKANELQLDDVVAIKASGNKELIFVYDVFWPDSFLPKKTRFDEDICVAFLSDVHAGSNKHLGKEFQKFIDWIGSEDKLAKKIKYLFFVGDNIDGVGIFPGQENKLTLKSTKEQYELLASYFKQIPKDITMFMCPGQHDAVRVLEPQPIIGKDYGEALYELDNLVLVSNPSTIKLIEGDKEFKILMYHGGSIHTFINEIEELRLMKAHNCPAKAVKHMLKRRHLAPMHGVSPSIVYAPNGKYDPLIIKEVPDILCTGEVHRLDIENYNGTLILTGSCWQARTDFEEKVGNIPDSCKVPVFNLKSGELRILDFGDDDGN